MWHDTFTYDIRKHGFIEYNHAYVDVDTYELDLTKFINEFDVKYDDLTTEKLQEKLKKIDFKEFERFYRNGNSRRIEFIKVNNEWKIKL